MDILKTKTSAVLPVLLVLLAVPLQAADGGFTLTGSITLGGQLVDTRDTDNQLKRWSFNGLFKLPLDSSLALRYTQSESTSDVTLGTSQLIGTASTKTTAPFSASPGVFKGRIDYDTWAVTWSATPIEKVDFRLYAYDLKRENKSSDVLFSGFTTATNSLGCVGVVGGTGPVGSATGPRICENEPFGFERRNYGAELAWHPSRTNRISGGYDQIKTDREFHPDSDSTKERRYSLEWRNTALSTLTASLLESPLPGCPGPCGPPHGPVSR